MSKPITSFKTTEKEPNKSYQVHIPDIYSEEEKCILTKLKVPADSNVTEALALPLVTCSVDFFDVLNCKTNQCDFECSVVRNMTVPKPVNSDFFDEIELHRLRCEVADQLETATNMATKGDIDGARVVLTKLKGRIGHSVVQHKPLAGHLFETVDQSMQGLQDKVCWHVYSVW